MASSPASNTASKSAIFPRRVSPHPLPGLVPRQAWHSFLADLAFALAVDADVNEPVFSWHVSDELAALDRLGDEALASPLTTSPRR